MAEIPKEALKFKGPTREKVRRALASVIECDEHRASTKVVSVAKLRGAGAGDQNAATELLRLWRAGTLSIVDSWDDPTPGSAPGTDEAAAEFARRATAARAELERMIRAAKTDGDRELVAHEVMAQLAGGLIDHEIAKEIKGQLDAALKAAAAKRATEPPAEDPTKLALVSDLAMGVGRAVDLVVNDSRRERIAAFVARELEQDLDEERNVDAGGVA